MEKYSWTQTLSEVSVLVPVPENVSAKDLDVKFDKKHLKISVKSTGDVILEAIPAPSSVPYFCATGRFLGGGQKGGILVEHR